MAGEPTFEDAYNSTMTARKPKGGSMDRLSPEAQVSNYRQFIANGKGVMANAISVVSAHLTSLAEIDPKMAEHERLEFAALLQSALEMVAPAPAAKTSEKKTTRKKADVGTAKSK